MKNIRPGLPGLQLIVVHGVTHEPVRLLLHLLTPPRLLGGLLGGPALPDGLTAGEGRVVGLVLVHGDIVGSPSHSNKYWIFSHVTLSSHYIFGSPQFCLT